jgi:hypothetical protein
MGGATVPTMVVEEGVGRIETGVLLDGSRQECCGLMKMD